METPSIASRSIVLIAASCAALPLSSSASPKVEPYGFIKAEWVGSTRGVESFSQPNFSAYTAAGNPVLSGGPTLAQSSFQVAQSRFGLLVKSEEPGLSGRLEMDFIDFSKSSPTTASLPRLRRAFVDYSPSADWTFRFGQDWSLSSPLGPLTYDTVGYYFQSGNIGFMRIQAAAIAKCGSMEHAVALSLPSANNSPADGPVELGILPALELRETWIASERLSVGVSAIGASLRNSKGTGRYFAGGATLFGGWKSAAGGPEFRGEAYAGRNLASLGMLALATGDGMTAGANEVGGYLTAKMPVVERHALFGGAGYAQVLGSGGIQPSYVTSAAGVAALAGKGNGIRENGTARVGWEFKPREDLAFYAETAWLRTRHVLADADLLKYDPLRSAVVFDVGTQLTF